MRLTNGLQFIELLLGIIVVTGLKQRVHEVIHAVDTLVIMTRHLAPGRHSSGEYA
jgi:uncharacterized membrane protein YphA (DoxX/SURF4 family)